MKKETIENEVKKIIEIQMIKKEFAEMGIIDEGDIISYDDLEEKPE